MSNRNLPTRSASVLAVSISEGGIPKRPVSSATVARTGIVGDGRNHAKHIRLDRAISLIDLEILEQLGQEGFALEPGAAGENLTVVGLGVQNMSPGTVLQIGDVLLKLEQPRKPCYVLDSISPQLKTAIIGRCGYMASVLSEGHVRPGSTVSVVGALTRA